MSVIITEKETIGFEESEKTFVVYEVAGRGQKGEKGDAGITEGADFVTLNSSLLVNPDYQEARFFYDPIYKTLSMYTDIPDVLLQVGQEQWSRVSNKSGSLIPNGSVCYVSGTLGHIPTIELALANNFSTAKVIGVATHDIVDNTEGIVTTFGLVHDLDTTGNGDGETWSDGDLLWVSDTLAGEMTNVAPTAPNLQIPIAIIMSAHVTQGTLLVRAHFPTNLASGDADGQIQFNNTGVLDTSTNFTFNKSTRLLDVTGFIRGTNEAYKYTDIGIADPTNHTLYWTNGRLQKITANADVEIAFGGWPESGWEGKIDVELIISAGVNVTFHSAVQNPSDINLVEGSNKIYLSTNDSGANVYLTPDPIIGGVPSGGSEGDSIIKGSNAEFIILKNNLIAIVEPTVNDDSSAGYAVKSRWIDIVGLKIFECIDATIGAANWIDLTGGDGGGEWTEIIRTTVLTPQSSVEFIDKITDDFDTYRLRVVNGRIDATGGIAMELGYGVTPTWIGGSHHGDVSQTGFNTYIGQKGTGPILIGKTTMSTTQRLKVDAILYQLRELGVPRSWECKGNIMTWTGPSSLTINSDCFGGLADFANKFDHIRLVPVFAASISAGTYILEGKNDTI